MAKPEQNKHQGDKIEAEPGADKRLANILKKALNTPPKHQATQDQHRAAKQGGRRAKAD